MIETAERAGVVRRRAGPCCWSTVIWGSGLAARWFGHTICVGGRIPRRNVATISRGAIEIRTALRETASIDECSAVGGVVVMVVNHGMPVPIESPVIPAPSEPSEVADPKAEPERYAGASNV